jgi:trans-aconitate methyltransferase
MIEDIYGISKRLDFVVNVLTERNVKRVLDVGCGTGANLTAMLAQHFPDTQFIAVDSDSASIACATRENRFTNVRYLLESDAVNLGVFDVIIASEVIEHVGRSRRLSGQFARSSCARWPACVDVAEWIGAFRTRLVHRNGRPPDRCLSRTADVKAFGPY